MLQVDVGDLCFDVRVDGPEDVRPVLRHGFLATSLSRPPWSNGFLPIVALLQAHHEIAGAGRPGGMLRP